MTRPITEKVLNLKEEIQKFIEPIHTYVNENTYSKTEADNKFAPKNHASSTTDYGTATNQEYGHVKTINNLTLETDTNPISSSVPTIKALHDYLLAHKQDLENAIKTYYGTLNSDGIINQLISKYDFISQLKRYSIAETYQVPNNYDINDVQKVDNTIINDNNSYKAAKLQDIEGTGTYITPGHYYITPTSGYLTNSQYQAFLEDNLNEDDKARLLEYLKEFGINYGSIKKPYANGLLDVRKAGNAIIQELYTTIKDADEKYVLSGEKYTRKGIKNGNTITWKEWEASHIPYGDSAITIDLETGINNMVLKENTAGYLIEWNQGQGGFTLTQDAGELHNIGAFSNELNIGDNVYTFSNHLAGFEIRIEKNGIYLVSNKQLGASIDAKYLKQTYFVPRIR